MPQSTTSVSIYYESVLICKGYPTHAIEHQFIIKFWIRNFLNEEDFFNYIDSLTDDQDVDFVYPIEVINEETDEVISIANLEQFEELYDACDMDWDEDDYDNEDD